MNLTISHEQGRVPVTVVGIQGKLDGSNYKELIEKAQELVEGGVRNIVFDLGETEFISSAGLVALHTIAKMLKGHKMETEDGWTLLHAIERDKDDGLQKNVKLLNPRPKVENVLDVAGYTLLFEIFIDKQAAIASF
jgi:anti-anti-sigma factor